MFRSWAPRGEVGGGDEDANVVLLDPEIEGARPASATCRLTHERLSLYIRLMPELPRQPALAQRTPVHRAPAHRAPAHRAPAHRGTGLNPTSRFERLRREADPDLVDAPAPEGLLGDEPPPDPRTLFLRDPSRSIVARNDSPDVGFDASVNPYRGCEHGCVYCLAPETPILHADLVWRPLGEIRVGDVLVGFDEHTQPGRPRKLRRSVVEAVWWSRRPTLRLLTKHAEVFTTGEHRWLQARDFGWSRTDALEVGRELLHLPTAGSRPRPWEATPIDGVEPGPVRDVVDIQTSARTFFAAGLATHNCYARPTHEYLGFSAGLDFETRILVKEDAPQLLRRALAAKSWRPQPLALSGVTDPYQPAERRLGVTRRCLAVLLEFRNPVVIVTKSAIVTRDADLLAELAGSGCASVSVSVTSLDPRLQQVMEPRASRPVKRLAAIEALAKAGVPVGVMVAPVVPGLTDHEVPAILKAAADAGAGFAGTVLLRLPHGVKELFDEWLSRHFPERRGRVLARLRELRGGKLYDPSFFARQRGAGLFADSMRDLFALACRRAGLATRGPELSVAAFRRPGPAQGTLFD
jgi:DNA repair photolyase